MLFSISGSEFEVIDRVFENSAVSFTDISHGSLK